MEFVFSKLKNNYLKKEKLNIIGIIDSFFTEISDELSKYTDKNYNKELSNPFGIQLFPKQLIIDIIKSYEIETNENEIRI